MKFLTCMSVVLFTIGFMVDDEDILMMSFTSIVGAIIIKEIKE